MSKITVIGSFVMDCVATMERFPSEGETILGQSISYYMGGKGVNQCVAASRLGGDAEMVGCVGNDSYGKEFLELLKNEGISCENVFTSEKSTAVAQIQINAEGQNRICVIPSANYEFGLKHFESIKSVIDQSDIVMFQLELRLDVTHEMIRYAKQKGKTVILNPAPAAPLDQQLYELIDIITPNETELEMLTGISSIEEAAKELIRRGTQCVVTTIGEKGAQLTTKNQNVLIPGFAVETVDTVAAGDSFNGALAVALSEGRRMEDAIRFANAMGALTVQTRGAIPSLKSRQELEDFLATH